MLTKRQIYPKIFFRVIFSLLRRQQLVRHRYEYAYGSLAQGTCGNVKRVISFVIIIDESNIKKYIVFSKLVTENTSGTATF